MLRIPYVRQYHGKQKSRCNHGIDRSIERHLDNREVPPEGLFIRTPTYGRNFGHGSAKDIKEALIRFKVDNSWMSANGVLADDIMLVKWDGSSWSQLETQVSSRDDTNTYFVERPIPSRHLR